MSSVSYASRLNQNHDVGGTLGAREIFDDVNDVDDACATVAELVRDATRSSDGARASARRGCVIHTGAGISRACGIPDFRGPNGVWTRRALGLAPPRCDVALDRCAPSATHQIIAELVREGYVTQVVSCNVDCLHLKSGIPRHKLAELHGNCFAERCETCDVEYVRDFEMPTVGFKLTGRRCKACGGALRDQVLDWDDALPEIELRRAERESANACLSIVIGSSMQIKPSCDIPLKTTHKKRRRGRDDGDEDENRGKLVIINLQRTDKDKKANIVIHAECDTVMRKLAAHLRLRIPKYVRIDRLLAKFTAHSLERGEIVLLAIQFVNVHDDHAQIPWLEKIDVSFSDADVEDATLSSAPFQLQRNLPSGDERRVAMTFYFARGCTERLHTEVCHLSLKGIENYAMEKTYEMKTMEKTYE